MTIDVYTLIQKMRKIRRIFECGPDRKDPKKTAGAYIAISLMYDTILEMVEEGGEEGAENGKDD